MKCPNEPCPSRRVARACCSVNFRAASVVSRASHYSLPCPAKAALLLLMLLLLLQAHSLCNAYVICRSAITKFRVRPCERERKKVTHSQCGAKVFLLYIYSLRSAVCINSAVTIALLFSGIYICLPLFSRTRSR